MSTILANQIGIDPPFLNRQQKDCVFWYLLLVSTFFMPTEQEYIARIKELESELTRTKKQKRYGLVWEDKKEDVVERCKHELPVLVADESKTLSDDPSGPAHILIE